MSLVDENIEDYIRILQAHDDPEVWETPPEFDWEAAQRRILDFAGELQREFGVYRAVESVSFFQDSSCLGEIPLPPRYFNRPERAWDVIAVRISNWGNMATVDDESALEPELLERVKVLLQASGYLYIPPTVLAEPYTRVPWIETWWIRYFDYL